MKKRLACLTLALIMSASQVVSGKRLKRRGIETGTGLDKPAVKCTYARIMNCGAKNSSWKARSQFLMRTL